MTLDVPKPSLPEAIHLTATVMPGFRMDCTDPRVVDRIQIRIGSDPRSAVRRPVIRGSNTFLSAERSL